MAPEDIVPETLPNVSPAHSPLRNRLNARAATFSEGPRRNPVHLERRGSLLSDYSLDDARHSIRSSTESLLRPGIGSFDKPLSQEPTLWHSIPLAFAILPAIGGLIFTNGSALITDLLLLGLSTIFLNWCVRAPWDWYHLAQVIKLQGRENDGLKTIIEDDSDIDPETIIKKEPLTNQADPPGKPIETATSYSTEQEKAITELGYYEIMALATCFFGPIIGAYILHTIRYQLSRPSEGLVSNYNLTIFVMAAEIRPCSHTIKLIQTRMLHLQRVVTPDYDFGTKNQREDIEEINRRLAEIEASNAQKRSDTSAKNPEPQKFAELRDNLRHTFQSQIDELKRAVRRYEKRDTTQKLQNEARFQDLEARLKDALSLAAAAARSGQRSGILTVLIGWINGFIKLGLTAIWSTISYPIRLATSIPRALKYPFIRSKPTASPLTVKTGDRDTITRRRISNR